MSRKYDRHIELLNYLIKNKRTTYKNLAHRFEVSTKTIKQDISELSYFFPITTFQGYGGGVEICKTIFINGFIMKRSYIEIISLALHEFSDTEFSSEITDILDLIEYEKSK